MDAIQKYLLPADQYPMTNMGPDSESQLLENLRQIAEDKKKAQMQNLMVDQAGKLQLGQQQPPPAEPPVNAAANPFNMLMPGKEEQQLNQQLRQSAEKSLAQQNSGIQQFQGQINQAAAAPKEIDWSPLASYFDSTVKDSNLMKGYKAPESDEAKQQRLLGMQVQLQKAKEGLSDKENDFLKNQIASKQNDRSQRFQLAQAKSMEKDLGDNLQKVGDSLAEEQQRIGQLDQSLASGDWQKISSSLSNFSRLMGEKGVLTDQDIQRVVPRSFQGDTAKFLAYMGSTPTAQVDPAYTKSMLEILDISKQKISEKTQAEINQREMRYNNPSSTYYGVYTSVGKPQFDALRERAKAINVGKPGVGPSAPATDPMTRLQELRAKKAAMEEQQ